MKNKLIVLIMAVPLVLIFVLFSLTSYVSLKTDVSVAGIKINNAEYITIDLAESNTLKLDVSILPANATNKKIAYSYAKTKQEDTVSCIIDELGQVTFSGLGEVKIIAKSIDGNYNDSILVNVTSSKIIAVNINDCPNLEIGEKFNFSINTLPLNMSYNSIEWTTSNEKILDINKQTGLALAKASGNVEVGVKVKSRQDEFVNKCNVHIKNMSPNQTALINGQEHSTIKTTLNKATFSASVNLTKFENVDSIQDFSFEYDVSQIIDFNVTSELKNDILSYDISCEFNNGFYGIIDLKLNYLNVTIATLTINKIEFISAEDCELIGLNKYVGKNPLTTFSTGNFAVNYLEQNENYYFKVNSSDSSILEVNNISNSTMFYRARKSGAVKVKVDCYYNAILKFSFNQDVEVVEAYETLRFLESGFYKWHNEGLWTIASKNVVSKQIVKNNYLLKIYSNNNLANLNLIDITSSNPEIATINNGELNILADGEITLTLKNKNSDKINDKLEEKLKIYCINGVNVYNYTDLVLATESGEKIAIQNNIMLGQQLIEKSDTETNFVNGITEETARNILDNEVKQIYTTADWTFYKNNNQEKPTLNYCIEFKNDVFGNGHTINAEYITNLIDSTNKPLPFAKFKGPLDMVALTNVASVKAQDNMAFLIRNNNVKLLNIELKSCNNVDDLTKLNYVGTTLEIMGDNVSLEGCYLQNGRNVLRIFGDYENPDKVITVNINKCVLRSAREFILKMGTNKYILGDIEGATTLEQKYNKAAPYLGWYMPRIDSNANNDDFVNTYVKTFVNLKNSMLSESGIFAIGIEAKFAGPCLDGESYNSWQLKNYGWYDLAGTSYPSILNLIGDVRIYDWKKTESVDSSTLIETVGVDSFGLSFDFQKIINNASKQEKYANMITTYNNEKYVHGGIALYGGGKNYSIVTKNDYTGVNFESHTINFDVLEDSRKQRILEMAAGKQPFRFMLYNNETFSVQKQIDDFASGEAFEFIYR